MLGSAATDGFPATVRHVTFAGQGYTVEAEAQGVTLRFAADSPLTPGTVVPLGLLGARAFVTVPR